MRDSTDAFHASDHETERLLLRAGRAGAPPGARERALVVASSVIAGSTLAAGNAVAGGAAVGTKGGAIAALAGLKGLAVVGVACVAAVAASVAIQKSSSVASNAVPVTRAPAAAATEPRRESRPIPPAAPARAVVADPPLASSVTSDPPAPALVASPLRAPLVAPTIVRALAPAHSTTASPVPTFSDELATLDSARHAINAGEAARALSILDGYRTHFPVGVMGPEASILRVEALAKAGDHAAAERAAEGFLMSNPTSPYASRVRSLIGESNP
jgi:hypothetical protein